MNDMDGIARDVTASPVYKSASIGTGAAKVKTPAGRDGKRKSRRITAAALSNPRRNRNRTTDGPGELRRRGTECESGYRAARSSSTTLHTGESLKSTVLRRRPVPARGTRRV